MRMDMAKEKPSHWKLDPCQLLTSKRDLKSGGKNSQVIKYNVFFFFLIFALFLEKYSSIPM